MNKETIKAIKDSIEHWEVDILKPLKEGERIHRLTVGIFKTTKLYWLAKDGIRSKGMVSCCSEDCALCKIYFGEYRGDDCGDCPLGSCERGSVYSVFYNDPTIETAEAMINTLKGLLK
jgi:hypothetical protein